MLIEKFVGEKRQKSMKGNESLLFKNFNIDRKIFKGNK